MRVELKDAKNKKCGTKNAHMKQITSTLKT